MVVRIKDGKSLYGALAYNRDKEKDLAGRVVLSNKIFQGSQDNEMSNWMKSFAPYLDKPLRCKTPVMHVSLNPHPDDRLTDGQYGEIARE